MFHVLIVEDDPIQAVELQERLLEEGYEVNIAVTRKQAIDCINDRNTLIDFAILDINLGEEEKTGGIEVGNYIGSRFPIIYLTAHAQKFESFSINHAPIALLDKGTKANSLSNQIDIAIKRCLLEIPNLHTIPVKDVRGNFKFITIPEEILYLEADGNYAKIYTETHPTIPYLFSRNLKNSLLKDTLLDVKIPHSKIKRINNSYAINLDKVLYFEKGTKIIKLKNVDLNKNIVLSENYDSLEVKQFIKDNFWATSNTYEHIDWEKDFCYLEYKKEKITVYCKNRMIEGISYSLKGFQEEHQNKDYIIRLNNQKHIVNGKKVIQISRCKTKITIGINEKESVELDVNANVGSSLLRKIRQMRK